jgi:hypothetical protein
MMKCQVSGWRLAGMLLGLAALPAVAHHSFAAEYDQDKPIKLTGTVTKFDVTNPHSWIYIDVRDEEGKVVNWGFETASAANLYRRGIRKDTVKPGTVVTIQGYLAKDGTNTGNAQTMTLPDGTQMILGTEQNPG